MSLNDTPSGERVHIGFFGRVNSGKSSLVNAFTDQAVSIISEREGTTTDPVKKAMELLPLGPVMIIDTPGMGDETELGQLRMKRAVETLVGCHVAILVVDGCLYLRFGLFPEEKELIAAFEEKGLPWIMAVNKADIADGESSAALPENALWVSALTGLNIPELKDMTARVNRRSEASQQKRLISDLLSPGDHVVLVIPIDEAAPKGRLILPQQLVMRDILDRGCSFSACQPGELPKLLELLGKRVKVVITDSQAFGIVGRMVSKETDLTSFSLLMARYRGELAGLIEGACRLKELKAGDKVLISEACTHHRQCNDIGTVKLPHWVEEYCGTKPDFDFTSGSDFPKELEDYRLIIHCGGCMINEKEMHARMERAGRQGIPMLNYGAAIACMHGLLDRSLSFLQMGVR